MANVATLPRHANFQNKRERKAARKQMVRAALGAGGRIVDRAANTRHDLRVAAEARREFYRKLRMMKIHRRQVARNMHTLAQAVHGLVGDVSRVADRVPELEVRYVVEAVELAKHASAMTQAAAEQWHAFSRAKIYYSDAVVA